MMYQKLYEAHEHYAHPLFKFRRVSHDSFVEALNDFSNQHKWLEMEVLGYSVQKRPVYQVRIGKGEKNILFWSQMHGNEATATMALLDIFNFFIAKDQFDAFREELLKTFSLHFIPVLNPDGMEAFERVNALGIDLNRDADRRISPESQILKSLHDKLKPEFGFNLHDQDIHYTVGQSRYPATISFLAPPVDFEKSIPENRLKAMQLIGHLNQTLQQLIPNQVAKYSDEYEPRAFGDNIQKWGTSTVLVESGGLKDDTEKQDIRKLNFVLLLTALKAIKSGEYLSVTKEQYDTIPFNGKYLFDLLLRNVTVIKKDKKYTFDIGINLEEISTTNKKGFYSKGIIEEMGDLSNYYGFEEKDCNGLTLAMGKCYTRGDIDLNSLSLNQVISLLKSNYLQIALGHEIREKYFELPINIGQSAHEDQSGLKSGDEANFLLLNDRVVKMAVVNGFLIDFKEPSAFKGHGLVQ